MSFGNERGRGYGDFGGLGGFNNFGGGDSDVSGLMEAEEAPIQSLTESMGLGGKQEHNNAGRAAGYGRHSGGGMDGGGGQRNLAIQQEVMWLKQDNQQIKNAVILLEKDRDNLRHAIRKLKVENSRMKQKVKRMGEALKAVGGQTEGLDSTEVSDMLNELDYDDIGKDFILIGGPQDPFSLRFEASISDPAGLEHKSAERYYWYKMAEKFGDMETGEKIRTAENTMKAEEAMKGIKGFDSSEWDAIKMQIWEEGQRLKFEQVRWIQNLLVYSDKMYIAVASQDKVFGTGWRKNREESNKPLFWDGENGGGKALMRMRDEFRKSHAWAGPYEEQETEKKYVDLKRNYWRRVDPNRMGGSGGRGGGGGPMGPRSMGRLYTGFGGASSGPRGNRGRGRGGLGYPSRR